MIDELKQKITVQKEVLEALPRNNKKNEKIYINKVVDLLNETKNNKEIVISEIKKRKKRYESLQLEPRINELNKKINLLKVKLSIVNPYSSSYEKSGLDKILYELNHFYENDLNKINKDIKKAINIFNTIGINLNEQDFKYSYYCNKYMEKFLNNEENLKENFEKIYWNCPEIIVHITLNFKCLYYKNQKKFDIFYQNEQEKYKNVKEEYDELYEERKKLINISAFLLQESFLIDKRNINDYLIDKVKKSYKTVTSKEKIEKKEIIKLYNNIVEYKTYLDYEYIIEDLKNLYKDKEKYKNIYINKKKEIDKIENKLFKNVKNVEKKNKKFEIINSLINTEIKNLKEKYEELEQNYFLEQIMKLDESTTIYDLFVLSISNYNYLIKKENLDINKLNNFITSPRINILKTILINEEKDISMLILDRYNILGLELKKEQLSKDNLDNLIKNIETILINIEMEELNISVNRIKFIKEANLILQ